MKKNTSLNGKDSHLKRNLIVGAAGLAVTAGALATGMALTKKGIRSVLRKRAKSAFKSISGIARELAQERNNEAPVVSSVAHKLNLKRGSGRKSKR